MDDNDGCFQWLLGLGALIIIIFYNAVNCINSTPPETPVKTEAPQKAPELPQNDENLIEGVVVRLIPGPHDVTTVVFENAQYDLKLGDHKIYIGEWNQLRVNNGFVQEAYLGEGTIQEIER